LERTKARLSNTDTEQELESYHLWKNQVKQHGDQTEAGRVTAVADDNSFRLMTGNCLLLDNTDWVVLT
jgi:hypothetical protein